MDDYDFNFRVDEESKNEGTGRRGFLGGMGALGFAAVAGMLNPEPAQAAKQSSEGNTEVPSLSSIAKLSVSRQDVFDVPGGKEYFYDWQASDEYGVTTKFTLHGSRTDSGTTYAATTDVTVRKFANGMDSDGVPASTVQQRTVVFGVKGETAGNVRNDKVVCTTINADGTSSRQESNVQVRLDLDRLAQQDFATQALRAGRRSLALAKTR